MLWRLQLALLRRYGAVTRVVATLWHCNSRCCNVAVLQHCGAVALQFTLLRRYTWPRHCGIVRGCNVALRVALLLFFFFFFE
jgi:hypothetical protein